MNLDLNEQSNDITSEMTSNALYAKWLAIKAQERALYLERTEIIEKEILRRLKISNEPINKSVSKTITADQFKIKVTRNVAFTVSVDATQLELMFQSVPEKLRPYDLKPIISGSRLEKLKESHHDLWLEASKQLSAKENKPTIAVILTTEEEEQEDE